MIRTIAKVVLLIASVIGLMIFGLGFTAYIYSPEIATKFADDILTNARAPASRELPPTPYAHPYTAADMQVLGGNGNELGCSITPWVEELAFRRKKVAASISLQMRQACVTHDYCYRHGAATYGYGQADCDYNLLEHAYRVCRFVARDRSVDDCISDARKILLGVRVGGSDAFKRADQRDPAKTAPTDCIVAPGVADDRCTSSYFEYDPYPVRAKEYAAYRIAQTPGSWAGDGTLAKSLYVFELRASGTRVTVIAWDRAYGAQRCMGYVLPASFDFLNTAPMVVESREEGELVDRFVWWRRYSLDGTGGLLASLVPAKAGLEDWQALFPGTVAFQPRNCSFQEPVASAWPQRAFSMALGGARHVRPGEAADDLNFSELHTAPGITPERGFRLMALRTHSCGVGGSNILCFHDFVVEPGVLPDAPPEPYIARDDLNRGADWNADSSEPDRYRNFVNPPLVLPGSGAPVLAFFRRGEADGETFRSTALLRRVTRVGTRGASGGLLRLAEFPEAAEPVLVIGRTTATPALLSIGSGQDGRIALARWQIPPPDGTSVRPAPRAACREAAPDTGALNRLAHAVVCREQVDAACVADLDTAWMVRPPVVDASHPEAQAYFVRLRQPTSEPAGTAGAGLVVDVAGAVFSKSGCRKGLRRTVAVPSGPRPAGEDEEHRRDAIAKVRARPVLIADLGAGPALLMPDAQQPAASFASALED